MDNYIGIDPGVNTGISVWNVKKQCFELVMTCGILRAFEVLSPYLVFGKNIVLIENPNLRKWYGKNSNLKLQGAGSIKRDYSIWVEWFKENKVEFREIDPKNTKTKLSKDQFAKITGYTKLTSEHARDACMMVFGMTK